MAPATQTVENRWDEKAGLRRDGVRSQVIDVLEAQIKRRPAMKKVNTVVTKQSRNFSQPKLTIGLDLGDRNSWYCVVNEGGQIQLEQRVRTTAKALQEVFGTMPRSRIALENRDAFALDQSYAERLGTRSDRGECAQSTANRGEPQERRPHGCADAGAVGPDRSRVVVSGEAPQRTGASRSDADSGTRRAGAGPHGTGQLGSRAGEVLRGKTARLQRAQYESGESRKLESGTASRIGTSVERNRVAERAHCGIKRAHRESGTAELSAGGAAEADQGCRHADRADLYTDAGRSASLPQEPRRGLLSGTAARTTKLEPERAPNAHQQGRRSVLTHVAGAGSATHSGTVRHRLRSQALGAEVGRAWREEREEASDRRHCKKARGAAASSMGERRSIRAIAQQPPTDSCGSCVKTKRQDNVKIVPGREKQIKK